MATSGTSSFSLPFDDVLEEASRRVGGEPILGTEARTTRRAINLLQIDLENRGILLNSLDNVITTLVSGVATVTAPSSTTDILDAVVRVSSIDYPMKRISFDEWLKIPNKTQQGRPFWYFVNRKTDGPVIYLWPQPDGANTYALVYWRVRFLNSASKLADDPDFPRRFYPALVAGLAYYLALGRGMAFPLDRLAVLKGDYEEQLDHAFGEDRERVSLRIVPKVYRR